MTLACILAAVTLIACILCAHYRSWAYELRDESLRLDIAHTRLAEENHGLGFDLWRERKRFEQAIEKLMDAERRCTKLREQLDALYMEKRMRLEVEMKTRQMELEIAIAASKSSLQARDVAPRCYAHGQRHCCPRPGC